MAADEAVVVGCEDGVVVYSGGELTKIASPTRTAASATRPGPTSRP
ncbi:hypothetical protein NKG05_16935 [Oerskovia sp. M15]